MGFFDRIENGIDRVANAMEKGWERGGLVRMVVSGTVAAAGEAVVQPFSVGMSLIDKGDAFDQRYQKMYDATAAEVGANGGDSVGACLSLVCGAVGNTAKGIPAAYQVARGKA